MHCDLEEHTSKRKGTCPHCYNGSGCLYCPPVTDKCVLEHIGVNNLNKRKARAALNRAQKVQRGATASVTVGNGIGSERPSTYMPTSASTDVVKDILTAAGVPLPELLTMEPDGCESSVHKVVKSAEKLLMAFLKVSFRNQEPPPEAWTKLADNLARTMKKMTGHPARSVMPSSAETTSMVAELAYSPVKKVSRIAQAILCASTKRGPLNELMKATSTRLQKELDVAFRSISFSATVFTSRRTAFNALASGCELPLQGRQARTSADRVDEVLDFLSLECEWRNGITRTVKLGDKELIVARLRRDSTIKVLFAQYKEFWERLHGDDSQEDGGSRDDKRIVPLGRPLFGDIASLLTVPFSISTGMSYFFIGGVIEVTQHLEEVVVRLRQFFSNDSLYPKDTLALDVEGDGKTLTKHDVDLSQVVDVVQAEGTVAQCQAVVRHGHVCVFVTLDDSSKTTNTEADLLDVCNNKLPWEYHPCRVYVVDEASGPGTSVLDQALGAPVLIAYLESLVQTRAEFLKRHLKNHLDASPGGCAEGFHCVRHALFGKCDHEHVFSCAACFAFSTSLDDIASVLLILKSLHARGGDTSWGSMDDVLEEMDTMEKSLRLVQSQTDYFVKHTARALWQDASIEGAQLQVWNDEHDTSTFFIDLDHKQKIVQQKLHESQVEYFGKTGMTVLGGMLLMPDRTTSEKQFSLSFVDMVQTDGAQDMFGTFSHIESMIDYLERKLPHVEKVVFISDNASVFANANLLLFIYAMNLTRRVKVVRYMNTEAQTGRDMLDTHFSFMMKLIKRYVLAGNPVTSPEDLFKALSYQGGMLNTTVMLNVINTERQSSFDNAKVNFINAFKDSKIKRIHDAVFEEPEWVPTKTVWDKVRNESKMRKKTVALGTGLHLFSQSGLPNHDVVMNHLKGTFKAASKKGKDPAGAGAAVGDATEFEPFKEWVGKNAHSILDEKHMHPEAVSRRKLLLYLDKLGIGYEELFPAEGSRQPVSGVGESSLSTFAPISGVVRAKVFVSEKVMGPGDSRRGHVVKRLHRGVGESSPQLQVQHSAEPQQVADLANDSMQCPNCLAQVPPHPSVVALHNKRCKTFRCRGCRETFLSRKNLEKHAPCDVETVFNRDKMVAERIERFFAATSRVGYALRRWTTPTVQMTSLSVPRKVRNRYCYGWAFKDAVNELNCLPEHVKVQLRSVLDSDREKGVKTRADDWINDTFATRCNWELKLQCSESRVRQFWSNYSQELARGSRKQSKKERNSKKKGSDQQHHVHETVVRHS